MTLIIAFKGKAPADVGGETVIIGSDSRETYGYLTIHPTKKIIPIIVRSGESDIQLCVVAGSGDSAVLKNVIEIIRKILEDKTINEWSGRRPTYDQIVNAMVLIEQAVINKLAYYRDSGLSIDVSIVLGGVDPNGKAFLWELDGRGVAHKIDDFPSYTCIGSGFPLGGNLLLQQFLDPALIMDLARGSLFVAYVIDQVSQVDPAVGPFDGEIAVLNKNGIFFLNKNQLPDIKQEIRVRQQVLRKLFMTFDLVKGAANLDKAITQGLALLKAKQEEEAKQEKPPTTTEPSK